MFGLQIIDIAIGLIFIYLILALTCTAVNELIASWLDRRTNNLFQGLRNLLSDSTVEGSTGAELVGPSHLPIKSLEEN
jgi:hypothetical protein